MPGKNSSWAIIPFEELDPRWKVLTVDGMSPLDSELDTGRLSPYLAFLSQIKHLVRMRPQSGPDIQDVFQGTNRDPEKMTSVVLTGTTALVRNLAFKMETNGLIIRLKKSRIGCKGQTSCISVMKSHFLRIVLQQYLFFGNLDSAVIPGTWIF